MPFSIADLEAAKTQLGDLVLETPTWIWRGESKDRFVGADIEVAIKLELLQFAGSFKPRGALCVMNEMTPDELHRGVTAISAGNHAIAVSYAAKVLGTQAKVVMPKNAPKSRVQKCREMGTEIVLVDDVMAGFEKVEQIEREEGRKYIHPFDGPKTTLGTGMVGLELYRQAQAKGMELDMAILPIGGGGLAAGMSAAIKLCNPECEIYGVEPHGACSMSLSFASGKPEKIASVETVAKSLGAPFALPYSFEICRQNINEVVLVSDEELFRGMAILFHELKLVTEPAAAATLAALMGPLAEKAKGKRVGLIACGSNIDLPTFCDYVARGEKTLKKQSQPET